MRGTAPGHPIDAQAARTVFASVTDELVPPPLPRSRRSRVLRWVAATATVLLVLGLGFAGTTAYLAHQQETLAYQQRLCPDLTSTFDPEKFALEKADDGECIGWTIEQNFAFSPEIADVVSQIVALNQSVKTRHYARVAVLMPFTGDDKTSAMTITSIRTALIGVHTALARADDPDEHALGANELAFQVVLVNEGATEAYWQPAVEQLAGMTGGDHPLVAVTGLGASTPETVQAAAELERDHIPVLGAALTATTLSTSTMFHVSASNAQAVDALGSYVDAHRAITTGYLLYDSKNYNSEPAKKDPYLASLQEAIENRFGNRFDLADRQMDFLGRREAGDGSDLLSRPADEILCVQRSDAVFFSGRTRDLEQLVNFLVNGPNCQGGPPIVILAVGPGITAGLTSPDLLAKMAKAGISVVEAATIDSADWNKGVGAPPGYAAFRERVHRLGYHDEDLTDGYAVLHYDALLTPIRAARYLIDENEDHGIINFKVVGAQSVRDRIAGLRGHSALSVAAGGTLSFDDISVPHGRPHGKVVPLVQIPPARDGSVLPPYRTP